MLAALNFPNISPEIFSFSIGSFEFALRWYALAYIFGILIGWRLLVRFLRRPELWPGGKAPLDEMQLDNLVTWIIVGVIVGGRLGFVLFYQPGYYLENPLEIIRIDRGGMAFHGGLLGVVVATCLYARAHKVPLMSLSDGLALATPIGIGLGRLANFINAELWGRPTDVPWAVIFPGSAAQNCLGPVGLVEIAGQTLCARHPSQLYEAVLEGLLLAIALIWLARSGALKRPGLITGVFFAGYGAARLFVEHFRQADAHFIEAFPPNGHILGLGEVGLTMGQILSLPMLIAGMAVLFCARARSRSAL